MSTKKKILISIICIIVLLLCLIPVIISNIKKANETKEEKENIFKAMECWAKGEEYYGDCLKDWEYSRHTEFIEENAIKIVKEIKSNPKKLSFFLKKLEDKNFEKQGIQNEINKLTLDFEEKISLHYSTYLWFYQLPKITKAEVETYIKQNENRKLYLKSDEGGFYDGNKDTHNRNTVGIEGSPLYDAKSTTYFGDFKCVLEYGVKLNSTYHEQSYSHSFYYFKDQIIGFNPLIYDCYHVGKYLFAIGDYDIHVHDTELKRTISFD